MSNFELCIAPLLANEGGISNNPLDGGKYTKYGISQRSYPNLDIASLTVEQASALYKRDYWAANNLDQFDLIVAFEFFDAAVNCGSGNAARFLQRAVGVKDDGLIGPQTIVAVKGMHPERVARLMSAHRSRYYTKLANWREFGAGWIERQVKNTLWEADHV